MFQKSLIQKGSNSSTKSKQTIASKRDNGLVGFCGWIWSYFTQTMCLSNIMTDC
jgi:hypothetical protein